MKIVADTVSILLAVAVWYWLKPYIGFGGLLVGAVVHYFILRPIIYALLNVSANKTDSESGNEMDAPQTATSSNKEITIGTVNPFSIAVVIKAGKFLFKCPTCPNTVSVTLKQIDPIIGVLLSCSSCKNICHVPGGYKTEPNPPELKITGSVRVPIAKYADWYYGHPYIKSLIRSSQSDLLFDYGLWAFCGACYHQFHATVLWGLNSTQRAGGFVFNARTPSSAKDMNALVAGHCSHCRHKELIVVVAEIPDYVRNVITSNKVYGEVEQIENQKGKPEPTGKTATQEKTPKVKKSQSVQKIIGITVCPNCKLKVLPKSDGTCPSCQSKIM